MSFTWNLELGTAIWIVMKNAILRFDQQYEFAVSIKTCDNIEIYILKVVWHVYTRMCVYEIKKNTTILDRRLNGSNRIRHASIYISTKPFKAVTSAYQIRIEGNKRMRVLTWYPQMFTNGKSFGCDMSIQTNGFVYTCRAIDAPFQNKIRCNNK